MGVGRVLGPGEVGVQRHYHLKGYGLEGKFGLDLIYLGASFVNKLAGFDAN